MTDPKITFEQEGFVIIPSLISPDDVPRLQDALGKQFPPFNDDNPDSWGVQHVMHPALHEPAFSQWYTSTPLIGAVETLLGCTETELQMELFNLLINPVSHNFALRWHRDDIRGEATDAEERVALDSWKPYGIQWNTALYDDSCLYVVPGSHKVTRTPEQRVHSEGMEAPNDPLDMPGAIQVSLKPGDTVFYNSNILHCAAYDCKAPRATLHASMGNVAGGSVRARNVLQHGLSWMKTDEFHDGLDARGKAMLDRLLLLYNSVGEVGYSLTG